MARMEALLAHVEPADGAVPEAMTGTTRDLAARAKALAEAALASSDGGEHGGGAPAEGAARSSISRSMDLERLTRPLPLPDLSTVEGEAAEEGEEETDAAAILDEALVADEEERRAMIERMAADPIAEAKARLEEVAGRAGVTPEAMEALSAAAKATTVPEGTARTAEELLVRISETPADPAERAAALKAAGAQDAKDAKDAKAKDAKDAKGAKDAKEDAKDAKAKDAKDANEEEGSEDAVAEEDPTKQAEVLRAKLAALASADTDRDKRKVAIEKLVRVEAEKTDDAEAGADGEKKGEDDKKDEDAKQAKGGGGGLSAEDKERLEALEREKEELEAEIADHSAAIEENQEDLEELEEDRGERIEDRQEIQEDLKQRKDKLLKLAEEAQQQGQEAPDADKDAQVRRHERDLKRVKRQLDDIAKEQKAEREDSTEHQEAREPLQERLQEVEQEIQKLQAKGKGGGGGQPLPIDVHATLPAMIAALEARKLAMQDALDAKGGDEAGSSAEVDQAQTEARQAQQEAASAKDAEAGTKQDQARAGSSEKDQQAAVKQAEADYKKVLVDLGDVRAKLATARGKLSQAKDAVTAARTSLSDAESSAEPDEDGKEPKAVAQARTRLTNARVAANAAKADVQRLEAQEKALVDKQKALEKALGNKKKTLDRLAEEAEKLRQDLQKQEQDRQEKDDKAKKMADRARSLQDKVREAAKDTKDQTKDLPSDPGTLREEIASIDETLKRLYNVQLGNPSPAAVEDLIAGCKGHKIDFDVKRFSAAEWAEEKKLRAEEAEKKELDAYKKNHGITDDDEARKKLAEKKAEDKRKAAEAERQRKQDELDRKKKEVEDREQALKDRTEKIKKDAADAAAKDPNKRPLTDAQARLQAQQEIAAEDKAEKEAKKEDDIAARVARARMLPSAERDKAMKQIKDEFKLDSVEQATDIANAKQAEILKKLGEGGLKHFAGLKGKELDDALARAGVDKAQLETFKATQEADDFDHQLEANAALTSGDQDKEVMRDKLLTAAKTRGCTPGQLLSDMQYGNPEWFADDPELQKIAKRFNKPDPRTADNGVPSILGLKDRVGKAMMTEQELKARDEAALRNQRFDKRKKFAQKHGMEPEEANAYMARMAQRFNLSEDAFLDGYDPEADVATEGAGGPADKAALDDELLDISKIKDDKKKQEAMAAFVAKHGTAALLSGEGLELDAHGQPKIDPLTGGPIATRGLAQINAGIDKIEDPTKRMQARLRLIERNDMSLEDLGTGIANRTRKDQLSTGFAEIKNNIKDMSPSDQQKALMAYADENGVALADLEHNYAEEKAEFNRKLARLQDQGSGRAAVAQLGVMLGGPVLDLLGVDRDKAAETFTYSSHEDRKDVAAAAERARKGTPEPGDAALLAGVLDCDPSAMNRTIAANEKDALLKEWGKTFKADPTTPQGRAKLDAIREKLAVRATAHGQDIDEYIQNMHRLDPDKVGPGDKELLGLKKERTRTEVKEDLNKEKLADAKKDLKKHKRKEKKLQRELDKAERAWINEPDEDKRKALRKKLDEARGKLESFKAELKTKTKALETAQKAVDGDLDKRKDAQAAAERVKHHEELALAADPTLQARAEKDPYALVNAARDMAASTGNLADITGVGTDLEATLASAPEDPKTLESAPPDDVLREQLADIRTKPQAEQQAALRALVARYGKKAILALGSKQAASSPVLTPATQARWLEIQKIADPDRRAQAEASFRERTGLSMPALKAKSKETARQDRGLEQVHSYRSKAMTPEDRELARQRLLKPDGEFTEAELKALEERYDQEMEQVDERLRAAGEADPKVKDQLAWRDELDRFDDLPRFEREKLLADIGRSTNTDPPPKDLAEARKLLNQSLQSAAGLSDKAFKRHDELRTHEVQVRTWATELPEKYRDPAKAEAFVAEQAKRLRCEPGEVMDKLAAVDPETLDDPALKAAAKSVQKRRLKVEKDRLEAEAAYYRKNPQSKTEKKELADERLARYEAKDQAKKEANDFFTKVAQDEKAATALSGMTGVEVDPAAASAALDAYRLATGKDRAQALEDLKDPEAFQQAMRASFGKDDSPHMRAELDRIRRIEDPEARQKALAAFAKLTGKTEAELNGKTNELLVEDRIFGAVFETRDLPSDLRDEKIAAIAKAWDMPESEVRRIYDARIEELEATRAALNAGAGQGDDRLARAQRRLDRLAGMKDPAKAKAEMEALSKELRLPMADVQALVAMDRSKVVEKRAADALAVKTVNEDGSVSTDSRKSRKQLEKAKRMAAERGQDLESFLDMLATAPDSALKGDDKADLIALRGLLTANGYEVRFDSQVEKSAALLTKDGTLDPEQAHLVRQELLGATDRDQGDLLLELQFAMAKKMGRPVTDPNVYDAVVAELSKGARKEELGTIQGKLNGIRTRTQIKLVRIENINGGITENVAMDDALGALTGNERQLWLAEERAAFLPAGKTYDALSADERKKVDEQVRDKIEGATWGDEEDVSVAILDEAIAEGDQRAEGASAADIRRFRLDRLERALDPEDGDGDTPRVQAAMLAMTADQRRWALRQMGAGDADGGKEARAKLSEALDSWTWFGLDDDLQELIEGDVRTVQDEAEAQAKRFGELEKELDEVRAVARDLFGTDDLGAIGDARAEIDRVSKATGLSKANAMRVLRGEPIVPETATPKDGSKDPTRQVDSAKVGTSVEALQAALKNEVVRPSDVRDAIAGLSPAELAEVMRAWPLEGEQSLRAMLDQRMTKSGTTELNIALTKAAIDAQRKQDDVFVDALKELSPEAARVLTTQDGVDDELARIQALPEEARQAEMERLARDLAEQGKDGLARLRRAVIGDGSGGGMPDALLAERLEAIDQLPAHEQAAAKERLCRMTGADPHSLDERLELARTAKDVAAAMAEVQQKPAHERVAAMQALARDKGMSVEEMNRLATEARAQGLVVDPPAGVDPQTRDVVAYRLQRLRSEGLTGTALKERLQELAASFDLSLTQLAEVATHEAEEHRKEAEKGRAIELQILNVEGALQGDPEKLKALAELAKKDPEAFREVVRKGCKADFATGMEQLERAVMKGFMRAGTSAYDPDGGYLTRQAFDIARLEAPDVELPKALDRKTADQVKADLLVQYQLLGSKDGTLDLSSQRTALREAGLSATEIDQALDGLEKLAKHEFDAFQITAGYTAKRIKMAVSAEKLSAALNGASPHELAAADAILRAESPQRYPNGIASVVDRKQRVLFGVEDHVKADVETRLAAYGKLKTAYVAVDEEGDRSMKAGLTAKEFDRFNRQHLLIEAMNRPAASNQLLLDIFQTDAETQAILLQTGEKFHGGSSFGFNLSMRLIRSMEAFGDPNEEKARNDLVRLMRDQVPMLKYADPLYDPFKDKERKTDNRAAYDAVLDEAGSAVVEGRFQELRKNPDNRYITDAELRRQARAELTADPEKFREQAKEVHERAKENARKLFLSQEGSWGFGDDAKETHRALLAMQPHEMALFKKEFERQTGQDLMKFLHDELWESDYDIACDLMSADRRQDGVREFIFKTADGWFDEDEAFLFETLEGLTDEQRTALVKDPRFAAARESIMEDLGDNEQRLLRAYTTIDPKTGMATIDAAQVAAVKINIAMFGEGEWFEGWGTDEEAILAELSKLSPAEMVKMQSYYERFYGEDGQEYDPSKGPSTVLLEHINSEITLPAIEGTQTVDSLFMEIVEAELRGDKITADAHRLQLATWGEGRDFVGFTGGAGTDEKLLRETLLLGANGEGGRSKEHYLALRKRFAELYGDDYPGAGDALTNMLEDELSGSEYAEMVDIANTGEQDDALALLRAMDGAGTTTEVVDRVMDSIAEMSPEEVAAFRLRFRTYAKEVLGNEQTLDEWLEGDLSGMALLDAQIKLRGKPTTIADKMAIARLRYDFEKGGGSLLNRYLGNPIMEMAEAAGFSSADSEFKHLTAELEAQVLPDGTLRDPSAAEYFEDLFGRQQEAAKEYRAVRDSAAEAIATGVGVVVGAIAAVATGGAAAGPMLAFAMAMTQNAVKWAIKGPGVSHSEIATDIAMALVEAVTAGIVDSEKFKAVTEGLGGKMMELVGKHFVGKHFSKKAVQEFLTEMVQKVAEGTIEAALTSAVEVPARIDEGASMEEIFGGMVKGTLMGGVNAVKGMVTGMITGRLEKGALDKLGLSDLAEELGDPSSLGKGIFSADFVKHVSVEFASNVVKATVGKATDPDFILGLGRGEGLNAELTKEMLVDSFVGALKDVATERSKLYQQNKKSRLEREKIEAEAAMDKARQAISPELAARLAADEAAEKDPDFLATRKASGEADAAFAKLAEDKGFSQDWNNIYHPDFDLDSIADDDLRKAARAAREAREAHQATAAFVAKQEAEDALEARRNRRWKEGDADREAQDLADSAFLAAEDQEAAASKGLADVEGYQRAAVGDEAYEIGQVLRANHVDDAALIEALQWGGLDDLGATMGERMGAGIAAFDRLNATNGHTDHPDPRIARKRFSDVLGALPDEARDHIAHLLVKQGGGDLAEAERLFGPGPALDAAKKAKQRLDTASQQLGTDDPRIKGALMDCDPAVIRAMSETDDLTELAGKDERVQGALVQMLGAQGDAEGRAIMAQVVLHANGGDYAAASQAIGELEGAQGTAARQALAAARNETAAALLKQAGTTGIITSEDPLVVHLDEHSSLSDEQELELRRLGALIRRSETLDQVIARREAEATKIPEGMEDLHAEIEGEGGIFDGTGLIQRELSTFDRVVARHAMAPVMELILEQAEASDDPKKKQDAVEYMMQDLAKQPGQGAAIHAIQHAGTVEQQLQASKDLIAYSQLLDLDASELDDAQKEIVKRAIFHLQKREIDFLAGEEDEGEDGAEGATPLAYRKVYNPADLSTLLSDKYRSDAFGGALGVADNTEGQDSQQAIASLGLLYKNRDGDIPFMEDDPDNPGSKRPIRRVGVLDKAADETLVRAAKVPVHPDIHAFIVAQATAGDPQAQALLDRVKVGDNGAFGADKDDARDFHNEFSGLGGTRSALSGLPHIDDFTTLNLEQHADRGEGAKLAQGDAVSMLDEHGKKSTFAVYDGTHWRLVDSSGLTPQEQKDVRSWLLAQEGFPAGDLEAHDVAVHGDGARTIGGAPEVEAPKLLPAGPDAPKQLTAGEVFEPKGLLPPGPDAPKQLTAGEVFEPKGLLPAPNPSAVTQAGGAADRIVSLVQDTHMAQSGGAEILATLRSLKTQDAYDHFLGRFHPDTRDALRKRARERMSDADFAEFEAHFSGDAARAAKAAALNELKAKVVTEGDEKVEGRGWGYLANLARGAVNPRLLTAEAIRGTRLGRTDTRQEATLSHLAGLDPSVRAHLAQDDDFRTELLGGFDEGTPERRMAEALLLRQGEEETTARFNARQRARFVVAELEQAADNMHRPGARERGKNMRAQALASASALASDPVLYQQALDELTVRGVEDPEGYLRDKAKTVGTPRGIRGKLGWDDDADRADAAAGQAALDLAAFELDHARQAKAEGRTSGRDQAVAMLSQLQAQDPDSAPRSLDELRLVLQEGGDHPASREALAYLDARREHTLQIRAQAFAAAAHGGQTKAATEWAQDPVLSSLLAQQDQVRARRDARVAKGEDTAAEDARLTELARRTERARADHEAFVRTAEGLAVASGTSLDDLVGAESGESVTRGITDESDFQQLKHAAILRQALDQGRVAPEVALLADLVKGIGSGKPDKLAVASHLAGKSPAELDALGRKLHALASAEGIVIGGAIFNTRDSADPDAPGGGREFLAGALDSAVGGRDGRQLALAARHAQETHDPRTATPSEHSAALDREAAFLDDGMKAGAAYTVWGDRRSAAADRRTEDVSPDAADTSWVELDKAERAYAQAIAAARENEDAAVGWARVQDARQRYQRAVVRDEAERAADAGTRAAGVGLAMRVMLGGAGLDGVDQLVASTAGSSAAEAAARATAGGADAGSVRDGLAGKLVGAGIGAGVKALTPDGLTPAMAALEEKDPEQFKQIKALMDASTTPAQDVEQAARAAGAAAAKRGLKAGLDEAVDTANQSGDDAAERRAKRMKDLAVDVAADAAKVGYAEAIDEDGPDRPDHGEQVGRDVANAIHGSTVDMVGTAAKDRTHSGSRALDQGAGELAGPEEIDVDLSDLEDPPEYDVDLSDLDETEAETEAEIEAEIDSGPDSAPPPAPPPPPDHDFTDSVDAHTERARAARVSGPERMGVESVDAALDATYDSAGQAYAGDSAGAAHMVQVASQVNRVGRGALADVDAEFADKRAAYIAAFEAEWKPEVDAGDMTPERYAEKLQGDLDHQFGKQEQAARERVEVAVTRAARLAGSEDVAVRGEVAAALARYQSRSATDPVAARAELEDRLYAAEQGYLRANVRTLNRAIGRLRSGDGMADLTDDEVEALLQDAVSETRKRIQADQRGNSLEHAMTPENLASYCVDARDHIAKRLQQNGVDQTPDADAVKWHGNFAKDRDDHDDADLDTRFQSDTANHVWTVVDAGKGRLVLMDPTFGQFQGTRQWEILMHSEHKAIGEHIAESMRVHGYVALTPEVAAVYGKVVSGRPDAEFTPDDFADHTHDKHDQAPKEDPTAWRRHRFDADKDAKALDPELEKRWRLIGDEA